MEAGQRQKWKELADRSPTYKSYSAQRKCSKDGILERHWESADARSEIAQTVLPRRKVKDVLAELHGGPSGGHLGVSKTMDKVRQRYYWLQARNNVEK
jgi:hypothetical protein